MAGNEPSEEPKGNTAMPRNIETVEDMKQALLTNDRIMANAILTLFQYQTADEQDSATTNHENGVGFNSTDAYILSSFACFVMKQKDKEKAGTLPAGYGYLSPKQLAIARKKMPKYAKQLMRIATANQEACAEEPAHPAPAPASVTRTTTDLSRFVCLDCSKPATINAWGTALCNGCMNERDKADVIANRSKNDAAIIRAELKAAQERQAREHATIVEQQNAAMLERSICDCGKPTDEEWNGLPVCSDCSAAMDVKENGRRYRSAKQIVEQEEATASREGRPSMLVREGANIRFLTPKEQYAAGYKLDLSSKRKYEPTHHEAIANDPFAEIPAAFVPA